MAKPDWGELQQRFLSEHAATGVSPKEWCEAQGLNYATARRYIKKPSAQTAQKFAQKKVRSAQKEQSANELMDDGGLTAQQRLFVAEYLKDNNATAAAARAGYSDPNYGRQLITNPNVALAIAQQQKASIAPTLGSADEVLAQMWQLATFDANQLSQYRRGACRYCWGFGHHYPTIEEVAFDWGLSVIINEGNKEVHFYEGRRYRGTTICRSMEKPGSIVGFKIGNAMVDDPLFIGMDFNVGKMAAIVHVKRNGLPRAVRELVKVYDTPAMIKRIQEEFWRYEDGRYVKSREIYIYPDASGDSRKSQNASKTDIAQLNDAGFSVIVDDANPPVIGSESDHAILASINYPA